MNSDGAVVIDIKVNKKDFQAEISSLEDELEELSWQYEAIEEAEPFEGQAQELKKIEVRAEKVRNRLYDLLQQQNEMNNEGVNRFSLSLENAIPKLARFGLMLFGIRSTYNVITRATNTYLQANQETAGKINSIWQALANLLGPIIEKIADWVVKLIGYLNVFVKTLSGGKIDLTKKMNKNTKSVKGTTKAMKNLNKQIEKFDEANVLDDNTSGTIDDNNFDLSNVDWDKILNQDVVKKIEAFAENINKLFKWIKDNKEIIYEAITYIATAFVLWKFGTWTAGLLDLIGTAGSTAGTGFLVTGTGFAGLWAVLLAVAAALSVLAVAKTWQDIIDNYKKLKDEFEGRATPGEQFYESEQKFQESVEDTSRSVEEHNEVLRHYKESVRSGAQNLKGFTDNITTGNKVLLGWGKILWGNKSVLEQNRTAIKETSDDIINNNTQVERMIELGELNETQTQEYIDMLKKQRDSLIQARDKLKENGQEYGKVDEAIKNVTTTIDKYDKSQEITTQKAKNFAREFGTSIMDAKTKVDLAAQSVRDFNNTKLENKSAKVSIDIDLQKIQNQVYDTAERIRMGIKSVFSSYGAYNGAVIGLASGGIINRPGPGVPLRNGVIGGERAPEGVIPLTNSQMMETLGEAIGRWVTINANIVNEMNGRVISRELQKINNENNFSTNR